MKAITVLQPWASLLIIGAKKFETRSWQTKHRGPILIHAGRRFPETARSLCTIEPFHSALLRAGIKGPAELPLGVILGTITLDDCLPTDQVTYQNPDQVEAQFGDFRPGRWAWQVSNPTPLPNPIVYQGVLGIFDVPDNIIYNFKCPQCDGTHFGRDTAIDEAGAARVLNTVQCNDEHKAGCKWRGEWPRKTD